jgi:hypothetical protein
MVVQVLSVFYQALQLGTVAVAVGDKVEVRTQEARLRKVVVGLV